MSLAGSGAATHQTCCFASGCPFSSTRAHLATIVLWGLADFNKNILNEVAVVLGLVDLNELEGVFVLALSLAHICLGVRTLTLFADQWVFH